MNNPGALTEATSATAKVGTASCAAGGTFEARLSQTITAQAGGEVTALNVSVGSRVSSGELLATLGGSAAETTLQNAALSLQNAQLSLQSALEALENYTITSPISGTVIEKNLKAGDQLDGSESGALAVIYDLEQLELKMNVSELDIGKIRPGQSVEITAEALPGETFLGTVEKVNINGTTTDGFTTYPVTILLSEYGALNPGMNVSADIIVEQAQQVLCIPTPPSPAAIRSWLPRMGPWAKTAPCSTPPSWRRARWSWAAAARTMWRSSPAWRRGRPCWCPSSQQTVPPAPLP